MTCVEFTDADGYRRNLNLDHFVMATYETTYNAWSIQTSRGECFFVDTANYNRIKIVVDRLALHGR